MGYGTNKKMINNFILNNNLKKAVKVIPFQTNPYKYLKQSDLLVLTSLYEGLPNVLLEEKKKKKFIISSNCPTGPKEILQNGKMCQLPEASPTGPQRNGKLKVILVVQFFVFK